MKTSTMIFAALGFILIPAIHRAQVNFPVPCKAAFTVSLDSLTSYPYLYHFKDNSQGNINSWHWDFGDGVTSEERNPSHQYQSEGNYQICLTVSDLNSPDSCYDQLCHGIITQEYYSLGGLVYAGEVPLNNPLPEGDTGIASIYRVNENQVIFIEDNLFSDYGYYWFGFVLPGQYLVKISLTQGSKHYGDYFTTYSGDKVNWAQAGIIDLENNSNYDEPIHLVPVKELQPGTGIIKGFVKFEQGAEFSLLPIGQTTVILSDKNKVPLVYVYPDAAGYFQFDQLPFDTYFLSADATGKPSTLVTVTLTESAPIAEGINLTIFGGNIYGVGEEGTGEVYPARIYPNPVKDIAFVEMVSFSNDPIDIKITDLAGKIFYSRQQAISTGFNILEIPCKSLPSGFYILSYRLSGNSFPVTVKFIK